MCRLRSSKLINKAESAPQADSSGSGFLAAPGSPRRLFQTQNSELEKG